MASTKTLLTNAAAAAGLTGKGMAAWGERRGYPVAWQFDKQSWKNPAVFTARLAPGVLPTLPATWSPPLDAMQRAGDAQAWLQGDVAGLVLRAGGERLKKGDLLPAVDAFLASLEAAGVRAQSACGLCGATESLTVLAANNVAGRICPACLAKQAAQYDDQHGWSPAALPKLLAVAVATFVGIAATWAALAIGVDALFDSMGGKATLPGKLTMLLAVLLGFGVALPALLFKLVRRRGQSRAIAGALVAGLLGVFVGEVVHSDWVFRQLGFDGWFPPMGAVWKLAISGSGFFVLLRVILAVSTLCAAVVYAKPPAPKLTL